jgi:hypothetical protein
VGPAEVACGANRSACGRVTAGPLARSPCGRTSGSPSCSEPAWVKTMLATHCSIRRAYCGVVRDRSDPPRPGDRSSPRLATAAAQIRIERLPRLLGQFEPHRPIGFPLAQVGAVDRLAMRRHVIDAQCDEIASAQFAIDRQIEQGQVPYTQLKVQLGPNGPDMRRSQWRWTDYLSGLWPFSPILALAGGLGAVSTWFDAATLSGDVGVPNVYYSIQPMVLRYKTPRSVHELYHHGGIAPRRCCWRDLGLPDGGGAIPVL